MINGTAPAGGLQHPDLREVLKGLGQINRVLGRHRTKPAVIHRAFAGGHSKRDAFDVRQSIKTRPELGLQARHHTLREQVNHAQLKQGLVIRLSQFVKLWWTPMLRLPAVQNLRNARACLFTHANEAKHFVQGSIPAIRLAALKRHLNRYAHQTRIAKTEHVRPLDHQH